MAHITTCTDCGKCYQEYSEEFANEPNRVCRACYKEREVFGPFKYGDRVIRKVRGINPDAIGIIKGSSEFGGVSVEFPYSPVPLHINYWELAPA
jgi:hypothetical protein